MLLETKQSEAPPAEPPKRQPPQKEQPPIPRRLPPPIEKDIHNEVSVEFKIYKELKRGANGELFGVKDSAVKADNGYVYIFRKLREKENNSDGTRMRLYWEVDTSRTSGVALDRESFGETNLFFFAYSRFKLPDSRKEVIRKDLDDYFIKKHPIAKPVRALYIPLKYTGIRNWDFTYSGSPVNVDMELLHTDKACVVTIYLYDWYGHIEKNAQQYQERLAKHRNELQKEVTLAQYANAQNFKSLLAQDKFTIAQLYPLTSIIAEIVEKSPAKFKNNMRGHSLSQRDLLDISQPIIEYEYEMFLEEANSVISAMHADVKPIIDYILDILEDSRANATFIDYLYGGNNEKELIMDILGNSLEDIHLTAGEDEKKRFASVVENIFGKVWLSKKQVAEELNKEKPSEENLFLFFDKIRDVKTIAELHDIIGNDESVFIYLYSWHELVNFLTEGAAKILDAILITMENVRYEVGTTVYQILANGLCRNFTKARAPGQDKSGKSLYVTAPQIHVVDEATFLRKKAQFHTLQGIRKGVVDHITVTLAAYNIFYQLSLTKGEALSFQTIPYFLSAANSLVSCVESLLKTLGKNIPKSIVPPITAILTFIEGSFTAYNLFQGGDADAATFSAFSTVSFLGSIVACSLGASVLPVFGLFAAGVAFTALARYFTNRDWDYFLRYCLWGKDYREEWEIVNDDEDIPSWWISSNDLDMIEEITPPIRLGYDIKKSIAATPYGEDSTKTIENHYAILNNLKNVPPFIFEIKRDYELREQGLYTQFAINLTVGKDGFKMINTIAIKIGIEEENRRKDIKHIDFKFKFEKEIQPRHDCHIFFYDKDGAGILSFLSLEEKISKAESMRAIIMPPRKDMQFFYPNIRIPSNAIHLKNIELLRKKLKCELSIKYHSNLLRSILVRLDVNENGAIYTSEELKP